MEEDSKFVPLNADDPMYGPPALLLIGFEKGETHKVNSDANLQNSSIFLHFGTNTF